MVVEKLIHIKTNMKSVTLLEKHQSVNNVRGNFIDNIEQSFKDDIWLLAQLTRIDKMSFEDIPLKEIKSMTQQTNLGLGGFYDDFGTPASWTRIKSDVSGPNNPEVKVIIWQ